MKRACGNTPVDADSNYGLGCSRGNSPPPQCRQRAKSFPVPRGRIATGGQITISALSEVTNKTTGLLKSTHLLNYYIIKLWEMHTFIAFMRLYSVKFVMKCKIITFILWCTSQLIKKRGEKCRVGLYWNKTGEVKTERLHIIVFADWKWQHEEYNSQANLTRQQEHRDEKDWSTKAIFGWD